MSIQYLLDKAQDEYNLTKIINDDPDPKVFSTYYLVYYNKVISAASYCSLLKNKKNKLCLNTVTLFHDNCQTLVLMGLKRNNPLTVKKIKFMNYDKETDGKCHLLKIGAKDYRKFIKKLQRERGDLNMAVLMEDGSLDNTFDEEQQKMEDRITKRVLTKIREENEEFIKQKEVDDSRKFVFLFTKIQDLRDTRDYLTDQTKIIKDEMIEMTKIIKDCSDFSMSFISDIKKNINDITINGADYIDKLEKGITKVAAKVNNWYEKQFKENKESISFQEIIVRKEITENDLSVSINSLRAYEYLNNDQLNKTIYLDRGAKMEYSLLAVDDKIKKLKKIFPDWEDDMQQRYSIYMKEKATAEFRTNTVYKHSPLRDDLKLKDFLGWMECTHEMLYTKKMRKKYRNRPEFYQEGDRLELLSYMASEPIKRLQIWYRICPNHRLFKYTYLHDLIETFKSYEEALGITDKPGMYTVECSDKELQAYRKHKKIISRPD